MFTVAHGVVCGCYKGSPDEVRARFMLLLLLLLLFVVVVVVVDDVVVLTVVLCVFGLFR
jgi:hypothetical protein